MEHGNRELLLFSIINAKKVLNADIINLQKIFESLERLKLFKDDPETRCLFLNEFYYEVMDLILSNFNSSWEENESKNMFKLDLLIWDFVSSGPPDQSFSVLCKFIKHFNPNAYEFEKIINWLIELLKTGCIKKVLMMTIGQDSNAAGQMCISDDHFVKFIQLVISLPTILANKLSGMNSYEELQPDKYIGILSCDILSSLSYVYDRLNNNQDSTLSSISKFISKICLSGNGKLLWKHLYDKLIGKMEIYIWRRIIQKLILNIDDWCIELSVEPLLPLLKSFENYDYFFGNVLIKKSKLDFLFTTKFVLIKFSSDVKTLKNILNYLGHNKDLKEHFIKTFKNVLEIWSKESFVKHRSIEQILYVSKAIMIAINVTKKNSSFIDGINETANKALLDGLPIYLGSSSTTIRQIGMVVGQNIALLIHSNNSLSLPYEKNEITESLTDLIKEDICLEKTSIIIDEVIKIHSPSVLSEIKVNDDLDSDDDLFPLNDENIIKLDKKKPKYLSQCIEGLLNHEDPERFEECLKHIILLVENFPEQKEYHKEVCGILLSLDNRFSMEDFESIRHESILILLTTSPEMIAEYLANEFYEKNYNLKQRMDILNVLVDGAKHLSFSEVNSCETFISTNSNKNKQNITITQSSLSPKINSDWKLVVQERIQKNTKRFAKIRSSSKNTIVQNKFASCAAWFFYPLMKDYDVKDICMDITGEDHIMLEKLLISLGTIMYCSMNIPTVGHMAKTLLQFSSGFQKHKEVGIRRGVMFCISMCLAVLESNCFSFDLMYELDDVCARLNDIESREWDEQCIEMAHQILSFVKRLRLTF